MVETVIITLIWIGIICAIVWTVIWALRKFGLEIPTRLEQIAWAIAVLVIILILWRAFGSSLPGI